MAVKLISTTHNLCMIHEKKIFYPYFAFIAGIKKRNDAVSTLYFESWEKDILSTPLQDEV